MVRRICDDNRLTWDRESESQCDTAGSGQVDRGLQVLRTSLHTLLDSTAELLRLDWVYHCLCLMVGTSATAAKKLRKPNLCLNGTLNRLWHCACWYYVVTGPWQRMQSYAQELHTVIQTEVGTTAINGGEQMAGRVRCRVHHSRSPEASAPARSVGRDAGCGEDARGTALRGKRLHRRQGRKQAVVAPRESIGSRLHCGSAQQDEHTYRYRRI